MSEEEDTRVLDVIVGQSRQRPDHVAVKDLDRSLSYAELIEEVAQVSAGLLARGVSESDRVALLIPNSVDFIVAALACLWIGAAFVPLAVTDPESRLNTVIADFSPALVITSAQEGSRSLTSLSNLNSSTIDQLRGESRAPLIEVGATSRIAYMIYTSGTTGTPKGVQISNSAFAAAVTSTASSLGLSGTTRTLCVSPFHFDGSYGSVFPTLISGGTVVIRPRDSLLFPRTFFNTLRNEEINYSSFTPSYLRLLLGSPQISGLQDTSLEAIALGGEAITVADLRGLWSHAPTVRVFNRYGPTETTIAVTNFELTPSSIEDGAVRIGTPYPGVSFTLVDEEMREIEENERIGELYIGGVQLMNGYWGDQRLTDEVLRTDVVPGEVLYRTGDLVYRDKQGHYVYVDRADRVIKRSGVRISLVELSALINGLKGVDAAACVTFDRGGELGIVAFVATELNLSPIDFRLEAGKVIPENMMPDRFEIVHALPLNKSNLLDAAALLSTAGLHPFRSATA